MHTVFVREHNRIANILASINPTWNEETLYQEARRIVIALHQHITYNEYLPVILGEQTIRNFNLNVGRSNEYFTNYDENTDPRIANEVIYLI